MSVLQHAYNEADWDAADEFGQQAPADGDKYQATRGFGPSNYFCRWLRSR
jgi:hypothetical protein